MDACGPVSRAVLAIARDGADDRVLAQSICQACVAGLDVDGAALSLLTATDACHTMHVTDATAGVLEELQFSLNEGICLEAAGSGYPVVVEDVRHTEQVNRWPMFVAAVLERTPARALFAFPLRWGAANLGVLDLYRRDPGGLDAVQYNDVLAAVDTATLLMLTLRTEPTRPTGGAGNDPIKPANLDDAVGWLDSMVAGRAEVHQATGMVQAQLGVSTTEALARLRARAFAEQRLLIDVAHDVVTRRLTFTKDQDDDAP